MDFEFIKEIKKIYSFVDESALSKLNFNKINLYKDVNFDLVNSEDIGLSIINNSDKKKKETERIRVPDKYNNFKEMEFIFNNQKISGDDYVKDMIILELEIEKNKFNYYSSYQKVDLNVKCFPENCKICKADIIISNIIQNNSIELVITCCKNDNHKFSYEDYC